ncbi:MAG: hypothetical protein JNL13_10675 [Chitinophagaceae bacterium]|nr:hypothetical protein [Chitinophagaceae bacterium]
MKRFFPLLAFSLLLAQGSNLLAQSKIKDGTVSPSSSLPSANAILELESANKGLLLPRVALNSVLDASPLSAHVAGITIYNTVSAGSPPDDVQPGFYYNNGSRWIMLSSRGPWNNTRTKTGAGANTDSVYIMGNAGIGIDTATARLDINGNIRVRNIPLSDTTEDISLVVDKNGYLKRNLNESRGIIRGYLNSDFTSGTSSASIDKITDITEVHDPGNDFNAATSVFTAPVTGLYRIGMTTAAVATATTPTNYVFGLAGSTDWVLRFTIDDVVIESAPASSGASNSFTGLAQLTAGQDYYFGISYNLKLLAYPSGGTGTGIGSYFEIQLLQN